MKSPYFFKIIFALNFLLALWLLSVWVPAQKVSQNPELVIQNGHTGIVTATAFSPDDQFLASAGQDGMVKLWDVKKNLMLRTLTSDIREFSAIADSPDSRMLAASGANLIQLWEIKTGKPLLRLIASPDENKVPHDISALVFSPDGGQVTAIGTARRITAWDAATGQVRLSLRIEVPDEKSLPLIPQAESLAFSADGKTLAGASREAHSIWLWDAATGKLLELIS